MDKRITYSLDIKISSCFVCEEDIFESVQDCITFIDELTQPDWVTNI